MSYNRLNDIPIMWIWVLFDMPVDTKKNRKKANAFRKNLLKIGFNKVQFSIYIKHCVGFEDTETNIRKVKRIMEDTGEVGIITFTDKQYGNMQYFWGKKSVPVQERGPEQLSFF